MTEVESLKKKIAELESIVSKQKNMLKAEGRIRYDEWKKSINPYYLQRLMNDILREYVANSDRLKELERDFGIYIIKDDAMGVTIRFSKPLGKEVLVLDEAYKYKED
jgi:hypothetical protein